MLYRKTEERRMHVRAIRALLVSDPSRGSPVPSQSRRKV